MDTIFGFGEMDVELEHWKHIVGPAIFLGLLSKLLLLFFFFSFFLFAQSMW